MDKQTLIEKIKSMAAAPSCCAKLKAAAKVYLDAVGTADEKIAAQNLLAEMEEDITTVENWFRSRIRKRRFKFSGRTAQKNSPPMPTNSKQAARNIVTAARVLPPSKFFRTKQFFSAEKIFTKKIIPSKRRDFFCKVELKNIS